jgi:hypothetical protein
MYEKPTLIPVGKAEDVVLGSWPGGDDIDGNWIPGSLGNAWDPDTDSESV